MLLETQTFKLQKRGNNALDYEDAFATSSSEREEHQEVATFALADGATEGSYSGAWANLLVTEFAQSTSRLEFLDKPAKWLQKRVLRSAYKRWLAERRDYNKARISSGSPLRWYEEQSVERGAFATFLGLQLDSVEDGHDGSWTSLAYGDTNLFHVRRDTLLCTFPLTASSEFNNSPNLIASDPRLNRQLEKGVKTTTGSWQVDDQFYLMTDALSCWFLREFERGNQPWRTLRDFNTSGEIATFCDWLNELRDNVSIRNDDVTLIRVEILLKGNK